MKRWREIGERCNIICKVSVTALVICVTVHRSIDRGINLFFKKLLHFLHTFISRIFTRELFDT